MHTVAAAPVIVEDEVVAVVLFGCLARRPPWSPDERAVLSQIARNAGHALGHGLSYQQTRESALTLQHSLLTRPPTVDGLEICARYEPAGADAVGGDWYDAFSLGTDNLAVVIGDVVGHDMSAAAAMGQLRATLRGLALDRAENPASILDRLDRVAQQLAITSFTSVVYGRLDRAGTHAWRLRWANAGHPPPLLLGQDGSARWLDDVGGLVLGTGLPGRARTDADVRVLAGDTVLLYTDGLVERRDRPIDVGMDNLVELVTTRGRSASLDELCDLLMRSTPADDDVAILAVRVTRPACFHAR
jgi:serine phosphatase RsbU (regulator of sigma subunit)